MDLGISNKVAIITGAQGGIGFATAQQLAKEGVKLVLSDHQTQELEQQAQALGVPYLCVEAEMTRQADVDALAERALERFGRIDIVVHATGVTGAKGDPLDMSDDDYEDAWQVDFMSAVRIARATFPSMRKQGWGRFVCITSENAVQPYSIGKRRFITSPRRDCQPSSRISLTVKHATEFCAIP
ncbi:SDR family NAD(P)-dependent oxidoreductase [Phytohalomonas tamaricis]|uniref:SDR family NAD(P)-dependent oxidoreductase n=1 Tax=Phytohalomonas tamaricis TaxID=2081032 RepID=UPI0021D47E12|nr:SDR family NAD(P)-dependent oxidoreductase [Phytohalomonas tamaricis]